MTTDERKTLLDIRNQLVAQIDRIDAVMEMKDQPKPKRKEQKPTPPGLIRIRRIFGHRDSTAPPPKTLKVYVELTKRYDKKTFYESLDRMERFYSFRSRKGATDTDHWSHDDYTLINNWDKKDATAREFLKGKPSSAPKPAEERIIPEPKHWREWAANNWPSVNIDWLSITWAELAKYDNSNRLGICLEIHRNCK